MGSWYHCSICGEHYGKGGGSNHRCNEKVIERLNRGRKTWEKSENLGREQGYCFSDKLKKARDMLFPD
jgi:hypothetical protein